MLVSSILWEEWFHIRFLILDLKTFGNSEDFISPETIFYNFAERFIKDSQRKETISFCADFWFEDTLLFSFDKYNFQRIEKFH